MIRSPEFSSPEDEPKKITPEEREILSKLGDKWHRFQFEQEEQKELEKLDKDGPNPGEDFWEKRKEILSKIDSKFEETLTPEEKELWK